MDWSRELGWRDPDKARLASLGALFLSLEPPKRTRLGFYDNPQRPPARPVRSHRAERLCLAADAAREAKGGGVSRPGDPENNSLHRVCPQSTQNSPPQNSSVRCTGAENAHRETSEHVLSLGFALGHLAPLGNPSGSRMFPPGCGARGQPPPPASGVAGCSASCPPHAVDEFR